MKILLKYTMSNLNPPTTPINSTNPGTVFGFGTWELWGSGRVPVCVNTSDSNFNSVEKTGGSANVSLSVAQLPSHTHSIPALFGTTTTSGNHNHNSAYGYFSVNHSSYEVSVLSRDYIAADGAWNATSSNGAHTHSVTTNPNTTGGNGSGSAHTNLQPYITCYMYKRVK